MYTTSNMGPPLGIQFTQIEFYSFHNNETKIWKPDVNVALKTN